MSPYLVVAATTRWAPRENNVGEFVVVVQASRLRSPYRQAGRLHHNWQSYFCAVP